LVRRSYQVGWSHVQPASGGRRPHQVPTRTSSWPCRAIAPM